jgi:F0F1-type ATP synthase assembly protein I
LTLRSATTSRDQRLTRYVLAWQVGVTIAVGLFWVGFDVRAAQAAWFGAGVVLAGNAFLAWRMGKFGVMQATPWLLMALLGEALKLLGIVIALWVGLAVLKLQPLALMVGVFVVLLAQRAGLILFR